MRLLRASIAAALLCAVSLSITQAKELARLAAGLSPVSYDLRVRPDLKTATTAGEETVVVRAGSRTDHIALNWRGLSLSDATIDGAPARIIVHSKIQQAWFFSSHRLRAGIHRLHLRFTSAIFGFTARGQAVTRDQGFYQTADPADPFLVTMFEPSTARLFFPCFDEPQFRAPITLHVSAPADWTVVSNMPGNRSVHGADASWDFAPTPAMPVYLLTLDAGRMAYVSGKSDDVPLRVYASDAYAAKNGATMRRALGIAERALSFFDAYLGARYPLPKLDLVIAPDYLQSALEQWGAITFYSPAVVEGANGDPGRSAREGPSTIAHEIAHQWFGDLVGMRWWNDVFVAEGLAQFAQERADRYVDPGQSWWMDDDDLADGIMSRGISAKTRSITDFGIATDYDTDDEAAFDSAAYYKSAAVVRMWERYEGEQAFRRGIRAYLHSNAGRAVGVEAFWRAFDDPLALEFENAWLRHPGFPIVTVSSECSAGRRTLEFRQAPFTDGKGAPAGYARQLWPVPIFVTQANAHFTFLLAGRLLREKIGSCDEPLAIDNGMRAYYRLRYAGAARNAFVRGLPRLSARDRANAVRDAVQLFDADKVSVGYLLDVVASAPVDDPFLQHALGISLYDLLTRLPHGAQRNAVAAVVRRVAEPVAVSVMRSRGGDVAGSMVQALAEAGDPGLAARARGRLHVQTDGMYRWDEWGWAYAQLAASRADGGSIERIERRLRFPLSPYAAYPIELSYLSGVTQPPMVREILDHYRGEPQVVFCARAAQPGCGLGLPSAACARRFAP